jgi:hypothetical protein
MLSDLQAVEAAFSGNIRRVICPGGAFVPLKADRPYWDHSTAAGGACYAEVFDSASPTTFHYASIAIPIERKTSSVTVATFASAYGSGGIGLGNQQVCVSAHAYGSSGFLSSSTAADCTEDDDGSPGTWALTPGTLTMLPGGTMQVTVKAQHGGHLKSVAHEWIANGT